MQKLPYRVRGEAVTINVIETIDDLDEMTEWVRRHSMSWLALDTEASDLQKFSGNHVLRSVQIGNHEAAWVVRLDEVSDTLRKVSVSAVERLLAGHGSWVLHNAPHDLLELFQAGLLPDGIKRFHDKVVDTYTLGHILDPRAAGDDNAIGLSLKMMARKWVDLWAADTQSGLTDVFRKDFKTTKDKGWAMPGLTKHPTYLTYAGLDVIYTARLLKVLGPMIKVRGLSDLVDREHAIQYACLDMTARGIKIDVDYTKQLVQSLHDEADRYKDIALTFGVENINSTDQVAKGLIDSGVRLTEKTPSGKWKVNKDILLPLAGFDPKWDAIPGVDPHPLAESVAKAKRAQKWSTAYAEAILHSLDSNDRVHATITSLAARTARMSISDPPLQQLPSSDWRIRRCFIPDDGNVFISTDFDQIELRVIAALAGVKEMISAIETGDDLHNRTATLVFGEGFTKAQRSIAKNVAFGYVYGAGPTTLSRTAGIPVDEARKVITAFKAGYPELPVYSRGSQEAAEDNDWLVTTSYGRELPVSPSRAYAATNYLIQSTARDLFCDGMMDALRLSGMSGRLVLPIHDELIHQAPIQEAEDQSVRVEQALRRTYNGVDISAGSDVLWGGSWGSGYKIPANMDRNPAGRQRMIDEEKLK